MTKGRRSPSLRSRSAPAVVDMADLAAYDPGQRLLTAEAGEAGVRVTWQDGAIKHYDYAWLRDNCACTLCRHPEAMERTFDLLSVPADIRADSVRLTAEGALRLTWCDASAHVTLFDPGWLRAHTYRACQEASADRDPLAEPTEGALQIPVLDYRTVMADDRALLEWCTNLRTRGLAVVRGTPTTPGEVLRVASRIGTVSEYYSGKLFDIQCKADTDSSAYTAIELAPHTDLPSRQSPPGYQFLHCLTNTVRGGESIVVDGFQLARALRQERPDDYRILSTTPMEFRFVSQEVDYRFEGPLIEHDSAGEVRCIRFNNFLQSPFRAPSEKMGHIYRAYRSLFAMSRRESFQVVTRLEPGDLFSFDNWRILHGRRSFDPHSGSRHIQGCYLDRDELSCRIRILNRLGGASSTPPT